MLIILFYCASFSFQFGLYYIIPAVIAQIFNPIAELVIPIGIPSKKAKSDIEMLPVIVEDKIRKCSISFRVVQKPFSTFYSSIHFAVFL